MIDGTYSILYIKWEEQFLPIGCLTSESFSEESDVLDTTTRDNLGWKTSTPTKQRYNISFDGLVEYTNYESGNYSKISFDRLVSLKRNRTLIEWKTEDNNFVFVDSGFGHITSLSKVSTTDEFINFTCELEGYASPLSESFEKGYLQYELQQEI